MALEYGQEKEMIQLVEEKNEMRVVKITQQDFIKLGMQMLQLGRYYRATRPAMHPSLIENSVKRFFEARMQAMGIVGVVVDVREN